MTEKKNSKLKFFPNSFRLKNTKAVEKDIKSLMEEYISKPEDIENKKTEFKNNSLPKCLFDLKEISSRFIKKGGQLKDFNFIKFFGLKPESDELKMKKQLFTYFYSPFEDILNMLDLTIGMEKKFLDSFKVSQDKIEILTQSVDIRLNFLVYHELNEQREMIEKYGDYFIIPKSKIKNGDACIFSKICITEILDRRPFLAGGFANINKIKASKKAKFHFSLF
jgi:hypothetical protein